MLAHQLEVVAVLDDRAQGVVGGVRRQLGLAEHAERAHPVDGLGDTRRLGQVHLAQPVHRRDDLPVSCPAAPGARTSDDLHLALGRRVADPVVEAAPLQRVVQLPGPVRGQDHDQRRRLGLDGADLGDA